MPPNSTDNLAAKLRSRSFRPRWWAVLATLVFVAITVRLGNWQGDRAQFKLAQQAQLDAALQAPPLQLAAALSDSQPGERYRYRKLEVEGQFDPAALWFVDNRIHDGKAGYQLLQPLRIVGAAGRPLKLLVDRGWIAGPADRSLPVVETPVGTVRLAGRINLPPSRNPGTFDNDGGNRLNYIDIEELQRRLGTGVMPFLLEQDSGPGFTGIDKAPPSSNFEKNRAYQVQWYSFAALAVVMLLILSFKKRENT